MAGRTPTVRPRIMAYLVEHVGKPVTAEKIQAATGLELSQIQAQMRSMIKEGLNVTVIVRGHIWMYSPEPVQPEPQPEPAPEPETDPMKTTRMPTDMVFEGVGTTSDHTVIVRDVETERLYVLTDIELR